MCVVYRHIRLDKNQPFYIGIGANYKRAYQKGKRSDHWWNIVSKTKYEVEILFENVSKEFAKKKEIEFIKLYGRQDLKTGILCNKTDGGEGLNNISDEVRDKIIAANKGRIPSVEVRAKMSKAHNKKVIHIPTNKTYESLKSACTILKLNYNTQLVRMHRNNSKNQFKYI